MPASYPSRQSSILAGIQPAELRRKGATLSPACRPRAPGHLGGNTGHLKSRYPFLPAAQQLINLSYDNKRCVALWTDHRWTVERLENTTKRRTFIPYPSPWNSPAKNSVGPVQPFLHRCQTFPLMFAQMIWSLLRPVSVAKKIKLLTMLSSNVQSIDLPMDCSA